MRIATYTNARGDSLTFRPGSPFTLSDVQGLGDVDATVQLQQAPYQDGGSYIDSLLSPRAISFRVWIDGTDDSDISRKRSQLSALFNPKLGPGVFRYQYGDQVRQIAAVAEHVPSFPTGFDSRGRRHQVAVVDLLCPDPYWRSLTVTEEPMAAFVELFDFPSDHWEVGADGDLYFEMGIEGHTRTFMNNGDAEMPIKITIRGPAVNPKLTNLTTGEFIRIRRTLTASDVLVIDTEDSSVQLNGEDAFPWIDLSSAFWKLAIGSNDVQYTADAGQENATLTIEWQERYNAV
ncbi:hypothetical protein NCCP2716_23570 [Sporosarcina sp. NCCP-2716]|uniref:phage tail family protein n=1 Tax=Sporosarcina sp. NCCP-2716 TaxID=2943679 RepID=UPI0020410EC8|nr:phage tail family protein [Sporosarcina sp. NCCP-2716]GKV69859.1 hypothetical protein NCCP2716_23570 [Sporosarcina sp. NCCP-2716]